MPNMYSPVVNMLCKQIAMLRMGDITEKQERERKTGEEREAKRKF